MRSEHDYARRARWRADLAELAGAASAIFGGTENQDAKNAEAQLHRLHAELLDAVGDAKDALEAAIREAVLAADMDDIVEIVLRSKTVDSLPGVAAARDALHIARDELRQTEKTWREIDQFTGNRARYSIINNFSEPSFAELEGMGY